MNYMELMEKSREVMGTKLCKSCPVCDGKACRNTIPGPGAKGIGDVAMRNYDAWKNIRVNMDTITDNEPVSTELELFGHTFKYPIFAGPVDVYKRQDFTRCKTNFNFRSFLNFFLKNFHLN